MGSSYLLELHCVHCVKLNTDIYYAPTCGTYTFKCSHCGKMNYITKDKESAMPDEASGEDLFEAFLNTTIIAWNDLEIHNIRKEFFEIAKRIRLINNRR